MTPPPEPLDRNRAKAKYGPWAVIAGASDGTGEGFARELAAMGINLVLAARREDKLKALGDELRDAHGIEYRVLVQDLMDIDAGAAMLEATADLDVGLYVSNAGADAVGVAFLDETPERWQRMVNMNIRTVIDACHGFGLRMRMRERGAGGLLVMSSMSALGGIPWLSIYASTKAFEAVFCEAIWAELRPLGIDVLSVLAPAMNTPCFRRNTEGTGFLIDVATTFDPFDVARQSLEWLPHGPLLLYPGTPQGEDMRPAMDERKARVEGSMALGQSFNT